MGNAQRNVHSIKKPQTKPIVHKVQELMVELEQTKQQLGEFRQAKNIEVVEQIIDNEDEPPIDNIEEDQSKTKSKACRKKTTGEKSSE